MSLVLLPGDGIGPAVIAEARKVLVAAGHPGPFEERPFGAAAFEVHGDTLPAETEVAVRAAGVALLGAGGTAPNAPQPSSILGLRRRLGLNLLERPVWIDGHRLTLIGHAFEGLYQVADRREGDEVIHERRISRAGLRALFARARAAGPGRLTVVDKPSVFHATRGLIEDAAVDEGYDSKTLELMNADAFCAAVLAAPARFERVLALSFVGDVLSDVLAALGGGVGTAASISRGEGCAVFEPIHGTAPRRAAERPLRVNPAGAIRAAALLLEHQGQDAAAIHAALNDEGRPRTPDEGGAATTREVGDAIASEVQRSKPLG